MRIAALLPALNEAQALPRVLPALPSYLRVVVVDNGSIDDTSHIARALGAEVVSEPRRGYGRAIQAGIRWLEASGPDQQPDIVVVLDADASDDPQDLTSLLEPILQGKADFVLGSRTLGQRDPGAMPFQQRFGNTLATLLLWYRLGHRFTDFGPFRALRFSSLQALRLDDPDFGWNVQMQQRAVRQGLRIVEVPVHYRPRIGQSKISGTLKGTVLAGITILRTVWKEP